MKIDDKTWTIGVYTGFEEAGTLEIEIKAGELGLTVDNCLIPWEWIDRAQTNVALGQICKILESCKETVGRMAQICRE
jgi:hypothetical protein